MRASGERFEYDEVFRRTELEGATRQERDLHSTSNRFLFERERPQRHIDADTACGLQQQHATRECELPRLWNARFDPIEPEQRLDERPLGAEPGEQREIHVVGHARLAPLLHGQAADEAEAPAVLAAETLKLDRRVEDVVG